MGPIARCSNFRSSDASVAGLRYQHISIDEFVFDHAATILVVQGMVVQHFFTPDTCFKRGDLLLAEGPFIYLAGELSWPWDPPMRLKEVELAAIQDVPSGMTREEMLSALLQDIKVRGFRRG